MKKCLALILMLCLLTVNAFAATVYQDAVAPQVVGEAAVKLADVGERENLEADLAALLETALLNLPVNPDVVYTDLFHAAVEGEVTVTFVSDAVAVLFSKDGTEWAKLDAVCADGTVTVTLAETGVLAFCKPVGEGVVAPAGEMAENSQMTTSVHFTPSVSGKMAPAVMSVGGIVATVTDSEGNTVASVPAGSVVITALAERAYNPDVVTFEHLEWAYNYVLEGTDPLFAGLVVSDLFDLAVYGEYWDFLNVEGNVMTITFETALAQDANLTVLCSEEIGTWHVLAEDAVTINADGTVTLKLAHEGVLAFAVEAATVPGAVTAP